MGVCVLRFCVQMCVCVEREREIVQSPYAMCVFSLNGRSREEEMYMGSP